MGRRIFPAVLAATILISPYRPAHPAETGAKTEIAAIGELALPFDPETWRIEGGGDRLSIVMAKGDPNDRYGIDVSITDGSGVGCSADIVRERAVAAYPHAWESFITTIERRGFDLHIATLDMGCRNLAGSPVVACLAYKENLYAFMADPGGCRYAGPGYDEMVVDLLGGLRER